MRYIETVTYMLPAIWASYYINGDATGLTGEELAQARQFLRSRNLSSPVGCTLESDNFVRYNDAHGLGGSAALPQECAHFDFLLDTTEG